MVEEKKSEKMDPKKAAASRQADKQSSRKVAASEYSRFIESLINLSPDMLYIYDIVERRNIYSNDGIRKILGYSHEEIRKMGPGLLSSLMHPDDFNIYVSGVLPRYTAARDGEHISHEYRMQHKSGAWRWIHSDEIIYKRVPDGAPLQVFGVGRDITERKREEERRLESEARFRELFETSRDGIAITDLSGRYQVCNHALLELLGYDSIDQLQQKSREELTPPEYHAFEAEVMVNQTMTRGWSDEYEKELICKTGERVPVSLRAWLRKNTEGQPSGMWLLVRDITERKRTEESLRIKEERYRNLFEQSPVSLWEEDFTELTEYFATLRSSGIADLRAYFVKYPDELMKCVGMIRILAVNRATFEIFDSPDEATLLQGLSQIFTTESFGAFREIVVALFEGVESYTCEAVNRTISGQKIDTLLRWSLLPKSAAQGARALISIIDITDRKRAEEAMRASAMMLQTIIDAEPECVKLLDENANLISMNRAGLDMIQADSLDQVKGQCICPIITSEYRQPFLDLTRRVFQGETGTLLFEVIGLKGRHLWLETHAVPLRNDKNEIFAALGLTRDITERKTMEQQLLESRKQLIQSQTVARLGHYMLDIRAGIWSSSEMLDELFGIGPDYCRSVEGWLNIVHPEQRQQMLEYYTNYVIRDKQPFDREYQIIRVSDNASLWVHGMGEVEYSDKGMPLRMFGTIQDITERKQAEEKIRQSEQDMRNILDTVDEGFIVVDRDYCILTANKAYCSQAGSCSGDIIGKHCYEVSRKTDRPCNKEGEECAARHAFETGTPHTTLHLHKDANGNILYVETKAFPIKDASGAVTSVIEVTNNITEKYLLEEERLKTQKLESIGTLAGGIAHDFNNLLQGVFGYISMAKLTHGQKEKSLAMLEQAEKALQMSVNLTTQLLTFSRGGKPAKKLIRLESTIENAVKFTLSGSHTDYRLDIASELWAVEVDEGQLAQVIQNTIRNANEALAGKGTVHVSVNNVDIPPKANPRLPKGGRFVRIDIQDNGTGIPEQNMSKIFDPYFTTKQKGSGLGLATSYSIIKNHGGLIEVKSEVNRGTTFSIYLPAIEEAEVEPAALASGVVSARTGKVLLMDDEDIVRRVAQEMLNLLGHEVKYAENGERAIELFSQARDAGRPFDLVILDLTVRGGMGGEEAIAKIRDIDPNVKAVVSSGYSDNPVVAAYRAYGFSGVLSKRYKLDALKECLNLFIS